jgi:CheY-like chemotaxis protein
VAKYDWSEKQTKAMETGNNRGEPGLKKRVLLVDDDVDFVEINKFALEAAGYEVAVAHNGKQALDAAQRDHFDIAVLDVIMTTPNEGFELARALRKEPRTEKMPLIMLSSINAVHEGKGGLLRFGNRDRDERWLPIDRFVDKPITPEALVRLVAELAT